MSPTIPTTDDVGTELKPSTPTAVAPSQTQRLFAPHRANTARVEATYGADLDAMDDGELLAMQSVITQRLMARAQQPLASRADQNGLSPGDLARIAEENHRRFYNYQCRLALLLEGWFETPEARAATLAHKGKRPFKNARDFIARLLGVDNREVERRLRIATANPTKPGASKMRAAKIEQAMADGTIDPSSANYIIDRLRSIRAASKRAGATEAQANQLVATKEGELLAKALHASPEEVRKFADRVKRATNRQFTPPGTRLTPKQRQYEEGLRFISALGDNHIRLDWVLTKWQYRNVLERLRRQVNNLRKAASRLDEMDSPAAGTGIRKSGTERITPAEEEYEMPMLYDDRTAAQRWSHFLLDILETGLVLTTMPEDDHRAQHITADHRGTASDPIDIAPNGVVIPGLGQLVNVAPSVTVGLQYADLVGAYLEFGTDDAGAQAEITALLQGEKPFPELYDYDAMEMDWAELRRIACDASIIPMVLGSKGEPLDVGRSQRAFPSSIRRAVVMRDGGCAYPGCPMPHLYCEVHHIQSWQDGGSTALSNAVMLCRFHHTIIHQSEVLVRLNNEQLPEFLTAPTTTEARWVRNLMHRG